MGSLLLLLVTLCAAPLAWAQDESRGTPPAEPPADTAAPSTPDVAPPPPEPPAPLTPRERLDEAVRRYQLGQFDEARATLAQLAVSDARNLDPELRQQARIYMGELLFTEGDQGGAEAFFRKVLAEDPARVLDPFRHPPDVVGYFSYVRALIDAERRPVKVTPPTPTAPVVEPAPRSAWAPLGVYHFQQGMPGRGAAWLTAQTLLTGTSFLTFVLLGLDHGAPAGSDELVRLQQLNTANRVVASAALLSWGLAITDAQVHWRRTHPRPLRAAVQLGGAAGAPVGATASVRF